MKPRFWNPRSVGMLTTLAACAWMPTAGALACESDADCAPGSACTTQLVEYCYGGGTVEGGFEMPQDAGAAEADPAASPHPTPRAPADPDSPEDYTCESHEETYCTNLPCSSDADCGDGAVCHSSSYTDCVWPEPPDCDWETTDCDAVYQEFDQMEPTDCVEHTQSECLPRYEAPCEVDDDCGEGFDCEYSTWISCSGSAPAGGSAGGSTTGASAGSDGDTAGDGIDGGVADEMCTSGVSEEGYCSLRDLPCATDEECPDGMTCQERYEWVGVPCGDTMPPESGTASDDSTNASTTGSGGAAMPVDEPYAAPDCEAAEPIVSMACAPAYWGGGTMGGPGSGVTPQPGGTTDSGGDGESAGGTGGAIGNPETDTDTGTSPPADEASEDEGHGHGHGRHGRVGHALRRLAGCSAQPGTPPDASWLALLVVLFGFAMGYRQKRTTAGR